MKEGVEARYGGEDHVDRNAGQNIRPSPSEKRPPVLGGAPGLPGGSTRKELLGFPLGVGALQIGARAGGRKGRQRGRGLTSLGSGGSGTCCPGMKSSSLINPTWPLLSSVWITRPGDCDSTLCVWAWQGPCNPGSPHKAGLWPHPQTLLRGAQPSWPVPLTPLWFRQYPLGQSSPKIDSSHKWLFTWGREMGSQWLVPILGVGTVSFAVPGVLR